MRLLRIGLFLGLMAWLMQLVVFVQPFLPGSTVPGLGVCQMVVDAFQPENLYIEQNNKNSSMPMQHEAMPMMAHAPPDMSHTHHLNHMTCGFCSLFGHVIPSSSLLPIWTGFTSRLFITLPRFCNLSIDILPVAYLQPKSRAPPYILIY